MRAPLALIPLLLFAACVSDDPSQPVGTRPADAQTPDGLWITWEEHILDDPAVSNVGIKGGDGLALGDLDNNRTLDIVSAHKDSGHIRVAFSTGDPFEWQRLSLAEKPDAEGVEDVDIGDLSGDGWPDVIAACEGGRLLYLQNPGQPKPGFVWERHVIEKTLNRGSWIRAALADFDRDGRLDIVAVNKGAADGGSGGPATPISIFQVSGDPLLEESWQETTLGEYQTPINAEPVDLDGDGDFDIFAGSRGENRVFWFENQSTAGELIFVEHPIELAGDAAATAFNVELYDFSGDGRPDALLSIGGGRLVWIEQPADPSQPWPVHPIGSFAPDTMTGFTIADINGDSHPDIIAGSYSQDPRDEDGEDIGADGRLGRIGWFANPGDPAGEWTRHDIVRRKRGMFDSFVALDVDRDGAMDFVATRGASGKYDGLFWLRQERSDIRLQRFVPGRLEDSQQMPVLK